MLYLGAILLISLLVIIHEFGHYLVARAFGMRVLTYSIGFGPVIARWRPRGSDTVFQIAAIPVLAYVQIAGMNPRETVDPRDRGSYQNASPIARFLTIAAGPLANYLAAALALFLLVFIGGEQVTSRNAQIGRVIDHSAAAEAGLRADDVVREINGRPIRAFGELMRATRDSQGRPMQVRVDRGGAPVVVSVTPRLNAETRHYMIGVEVKSETRPVSFGRALEVGFVGSTEATAGMVRGLIAMARRTVPVQLVGPVGIVSETVQQARHGWRNVLDWIALISLNLFIFNLLPIPALDGGRLLVLLYEMGTKRKIDPALEARVLAASLMLMLGLFLVVTSRELWGIFSTLLRRGT